PVIVNTHGRHDPCVGIRATPIAEAMLACVLMDHALRHRAQNADVVVDTPRGRTPMFCNVRAAGAPSTIPILTRRKAGVRFDLSGQAREIARNASDKSNVTLLIRPPRPS